MQKDEIVVPDLSPEFIKEKIYIIRGKKVMFDKDLALLYGVPTKVLNQAVKRNIERFPQDFMFKVNKEEADYFLRSQFVTLENTQEFSHIKHIPYAFTEHGIAMLSSVLNSERAIAVNIQIIRIFTKLREMVEMYKELREKVEEMEKNNETNFSEVFKVLRFLVNEDDKEGGRIGFNIQKLS